MSDKQFYEIGLWVQKNPIWFLVIIFVIELLIVWCGVHVSKKKKNR